MSSVKPPEEGAEQRQQSPVAEDAKKLQRVSGPIAQESPEHRPSPEIQMAALYSQFQGPLPSPDMMQAYKKVDPTFPERFVVSWEEETQHRRSLENQELGLDSRSLGLVARSQIMGFILAIIFFG